MKLIAKGTKAVAIFLIWMTGKQKKDKTVLW